VNAKFDEKYQLMALMQQVVKVDIEKKMLFETGFEPLLFIHTPSMSYFYDVNNKLVIFNRVNNAIITLSNPISFLS